MPCANIVYRTWLCRALYNAFIRHFIDLGFAELYTMPCASIALATFMKPATLAPFT